MSRLLIVGLLIGAVALLAFAQNDQDHRDYCNTFSECGACTRASNDTLSEGGRCYWCRKTKETSDARCLPYGFDLPIAATSACPNLNYNIDNCTITALIYVIIIVILVVLVLTGCCIFICCCCCYCHRRRLRQRELEDEMYMQEKDAIHKRSSERRAERKAKNDEIRKKYGLNEDTTGTYKRLE